MRATMPAIEVLGFVRNPPVAAVARKWCHEIAIQIVARLGSSGKNHLHGENCQGKGKAMEGPVRQRQERMQHLSVSQTPQWHSMSLKPGRSL